MVLGFPSHFFISNMSWLLPIVFELLCINLLCEQHQNSLFPVEWRARVGWRCLNNLKIAFWLLLSRWRRWEVVALLFFSKIEYGMGSTSRYVAHPLSVLLQTSWGPRVGCIQPFEFWDWLPLRLQLFPSIYSIVFGPNNCIISTSWVMGLWIVPRVSYNGPRWLIGCCIGHFNGLGYIYISGCGFF